MSDAEGRTDRDDGAPENGVNQHRRTRADAVTEDDINELWQELDRIEEGIEDRTVHRERLERDLKGYVRKRTRRGHATGWGPYLVLLYGTAMTLGAFYFLSGIWAILAMLVVWLSTLGLYALMVLVSATITAAGVPGRLLDWVRNVSFR